MTKIQQIRAGQSINLYPGKNKVRKLWNWCRAKSEIEGNTVNVRVLRSSDYSTMKIVERKRIGRARPTITIYPIYNDLTERNEIGHVFISWSYVY